MYSGSPSTSNEISDKEALQNLLLDIQCLDRLSKWSNRFNLFDVLKISGTEIRHSNVLAWLLDPNENHGLGDAVLRRLLQTLVINSPQADVFHSLLMDLYGFTVLREWEHIDLLAVSHEERFLLCIENKVFSGEHDHQLARYQELLEKEYPQYHKIFAFLTPGGTEPEEETACGTWQSISYEQIIEVVEAAKFEKTLSAEVSYFIDQYLDAVRRHIVGDRELEKICREIYAKHRQALDLIYENRPDTASQISSIVQEWCEEKSHTGEISFDPQYSGKTYIRFTTPYMTKLLPEFEEEKSGWSSKSMYYYEVVNYGNSIKVVLTVGRDNLSAHQMGCCEQLSTLLNQPDKKEAWRWKRLFATRRHSIKADPLTDDLHKELFQAMDQYWEQIADFEHKTCTAIEQSSQTLDGNLPV